MVTTFFSKKAARKLRGYPVGYLYDMRVKTGDVGIEIEVEGNKFPKERSQLPSIWEYKHDGSLRGQDNAEYVTRGPIPFDNVAEACNQLWDTLTGFGSVLDVSNRTSVHVHLNVGNFHLNRLASFAALYFSVEEVLTNWCGEHREGNLFCLRVKDAPNILSSLKALLVSGRSWQFGNGLHYSGFNPQAIQKLGSIEIRSMRGVLKPQEVIDWVAILERIYKLSAEFPDPRQICDNFSGSGPMAYLNFVLGEHTQKVMEGLTNMSHQDVMNSLYEGIRYAQDICYCRDWDEYEPVVIKEDPFKRRVTPKMINFEDTGTGETITFNTLSVLGMANVGISPEPVALIEEDEIDDMGFEDEEDF